MEIFARKCAISGLGMNQGWYINGNYYSTLEMANEVAIESGWKCWDDMYTNSNEDVFYTEWDSEDELNNSQEIFYLKDGTSITVTKNEEK